MRRFAEDCRKIVTIEAIEARGPSARFRVTPNKYGKCGIVFSDVRGNHVLLPANIAGSTRRNRSRVARDGEAGSSTKNSVQSRWLVVADHVGQRDFECAGTRLFIAGSLHSQKPGSANQIGRLQSP
jgi:hypothetical protein